LLLFYRRPQWLVSGKIGDFPGGNAVENIGEAQHTYKDLFIAIHCEVCHTRVDLASLLGVGREVKRPTGNVQNLEAAVRSAPDRLLDSIAEGSLYRNPAKRKG